MITLEVKVGDPNPARSRASRRKIRETVGAKSVETPITVIWRREDGTTYSYVYAPGNTHKLTVLG